MKNETNFMLAGLSKAQIIKAINSNFELMKQDILVVYEYANSLRISAFDGIGIWEYYIKAEDVDMFLTDENYDDFELEYLGYCEVINMYNLQVTSYQMDLLKRGVEMRSLHFINKAYQEKDTNEKARMIDIADDYHSLWEFLVDECDLQDKMKGGE